MIEFLDMINNKCRMLLSRLTEDRATKLDHLDANISSRVSANDDRLNSLAHLDVDVSSRLAASDYISSPIKTRQSGAFSFTAGSSGSISLGASVNPSKALLICSVRNSNSHNTSTGYACAITVGLSLNSNGDAINYSAGAALYNSSNTSGTCYWQLIEFV